MRWLACLIGVLGLGILLVPNSAADDKKAPDKVEAKDTDKNDPETKVTDDKKKKEPKKDADKVIYGDTFKGKLVRIDANSAKEFTIQVPQTDPVKVNQLNMWKMNQMTRIMTQVQPRDRPKQIFDFQMQLARKQNTEIYSMKDKDLAAGENCKFRSISPPVEFDEKGKQKVYTQKELKALRGNSKLPGYPAEFDRLAVGQVVTVYLAKVKTPAKGDSATTKKKTPDDDDPVVPTRPEAVMVVIEHEAPMQK